MFKKIKQIHFVGIGGSGMSGIAEVLLKLGYRVTGSDKSKNREAQRLEELGAVVFEGHKAVQVKGADVVVTSTAIPADNPEVKEAHAAGIPVIPRIEMLAELARLKYTIAIAGTHGKTTTSSMVGQILKFCGMDPTVIVGGRLKAVGTGGVLGNGDFLVAEADESDGSFLKLSPAISVITNIDSDHMDFYKTAERLEEAFVTFANRIPFYGVVHLCGDDARLKKILPRLTRRFQTYGFTSTCDLRADRIRITPISSTFDVALHGKKLGEITLHIPGRHNILNSLAALAVGLDVDVSFEQVAQALKEFSGVGRRLEQKGSNHGIIIIDDYGHHPTEMRATISALRDRYPDRRIAVAFQPHRYSRTKLLYKEFAQVLGMPDMVFLLPVYAAGEKPLKGVSSQMIFSRIKKKNKKLWHHPPSSADLLADLKEGDVFLTLGAGDVWKIGEDLLKVSSSLGPRLAEAVAELKARIKSEEPLSRHCTWGIGGPAEAYIEIQHLDELKKILWFCRNNKVPFFILGWGSNVLIPDEGLRGCVLRLRGDFESMQVSNSTVRAGAGVHLPKLAKYCAERNLTGTEALAGIPGTVGGALMTNAGTPRGDIGDVVQSVDILNKDGSVTTLKKDQIILGYRTSSLQGLWIVSAVLALRSSDNGDAKNKIRAELSHREKTQPLGTKNVGSVFRNPPNDFAARLIEAVGLEGKSFGHVRFSPKHANFMENTGGASAQEALALIHKAQALVKEKFGIDLEPEVKILMQADVPL